MSQITTFRLQSLKVRGEGGWSDLEFGLLGHEMQDEEAFHLFCVAAHHHGEPVAFNVLWPTVWNHDPPRGAPSGIFAYNANIAFVSAQPLERTFLNVLAAIYRQPPPKQGMAHFTEVHAVTMRGDPDRVLNEPVTVKLLFGAEEDAVIPYAEAYLTIDVRNRSVLLHEKDPEWRAAIVEGLMKGTITERDIRAA